MVNSDDKDIQNAVEFVKDLKKYKEEIEILGRNVK